MNTRTRVKICGLKQLDDAELCADLGADSIGLVFHEPSSRYLDIESAIRIRRALPPFITVTALFLNESDDWVSQIVEKVKPDCLQFHGNETVETCESFGLPYIKAIPMGSVSSAEKYAAQFRNAQGFLLDSNVAGRMGGSGDTFDWSKIPSSFGAPLVLAGGLNPGNVAEAINQVKPWAVDVSSGVESQKGVKDKALIKQFFSEVNRGNTNA